jgi:hypothetical protein
MTETIRAKPAGYRATAGIRTNPAPNIITHRIIDYQRICGPHCTIFHPSNSGAARDARFAIHRTRRSVRSTVIACTAKVRVHVIGFYKTNSSYP